MVDQGLSETLSPIGKFLPSRAYEVDAILAFSFDSAAPAGLKNKTLCLESPEYDPNDPPRGFVRLGTEVTDETPSHVGCRIYYRFMSTTNSDICGVLEENYSLFSFKFLPKECLIAHRPALPEELLSLTQFSMARSDGRVGVENWIDYTEKEMHCLHITPNSTEPFCNISYHRVSSAPFSSDDLDIHGLIKNLQHVQHMRVLFPYDPILVDHLQKSISNHCCGQEVQSWRTMLPSTALQHWPRNVQTQIVCGSTDILNGLKKQTRRHVIYDGPGTDLDSRPRAQLFKAFIHAEYPKLRHEPALQVYPIFLDVPGVCIKLPFGASMINRVNIFAGITVLQKLLDLPIRDPDFGIVAFYPAQVEAYRHALRQCHAYYPEKGYDKIRAHLLEDWIGKEIGIAVVDFVRTPNASGNLGHLSQARRIQASLSLHRDGLIVIGDRKCTLAANGTISSNKLETALRWFDDNGRLVRVSTIGIPLPPEEQPQTTKPTQSTEQEPLSSQLRPIPDMPPTFKTPRNAGIPELERDEKKKVPKTSRKEMKKQLGSASESFARQLRVLSLEQHTENTK